MPKIFKNKTNNKKYRIEILKNPYPYLDGHSRLGVYAYPWLWEGKILFFKSTDYNGACKNYIKQNFIEISYT